MVFSVKNDVRALQKKHKKLIQAILQEKEKLAIYKIEWQSLTSTENIRALQEKLMPEYQTVHYKQIVSDTHLAQYPATKTTAQERHLTRYLNDSPSGYDLFTTISLEDKK